MSKLAKTFLAAAVAQAALESAPQDDTNAVATAGEDTAVADATQTTIAPAMEELQEELSAVSGQTAEDAPANDFPADAVVAAVDAPAAADTTDVNVLSDIAATADTTAAVQDAAEVIEPIAAADAVEDDATVSVEGLKGALKGFLLGGAANISGSVVGSVAGPAGTLVGKVAASSAVDSALKIEREKLKRDIEHISSRIAMIKNGDIEAAKKAGIKVPDSVEKVSKITVMKSAILGNVIPFYTTYQGHKAEELEKQLAVKMAELKQAFSAHGHSVESFVDEFTTGLNDETPIDEASTEGEGDEAVPYEIDAVDEIDDSDADLRETAEAEKFVQEAFNSRELKLAPAELQVANEALSEIRQVLEALNNTGGVNKNSLPFFQIALEARTSAFELPSVLLGVALEAFDDEQDRHQVSLDHLDETIALIEQSRANVVVSNEARTVDVSAEQLFSLESEQVHLAQIELQRQNDLEACDTGVTSLEGIADIGSLIAQQNAAGGLDLESLVAASLALEAYTQPLGLGEVDLVPGLEQLEAGQRVVVSTEAIEVALEGVGSWLADKVKRAYATFIRGWGLLYPKFTIMSKRLGSLIEIAQKTPGKVPSGAKVKPATLYLDDDNKAPADMVAFLTGYAKVAEVLIGKFHDRANKDFDANIKLVRALSDISDAESFEKTLTNIANGFKDPRDMLSEAQKAHHVPGSRRHFKSIRPLYDGKMEAAKKLDLFATKDIPTRVMHDRQSDGWKVLHEDYEEYTAMQPEEVIKVVTAIKAAIDALSTLRVFIESQSANASFSFPFAPVTALVKIARRVVVFGDKFSGEAKSQFKSEIDALRRAVDMSNYMRFHISYDNALTAHTVASGVIKYAKASLKLADKPATESLEESVSLEGADPKKLRSGVKVRFSHGHGKVVKVYTADFMFAKRHHKASKDEPKYGVKDQRGYVTFHKASALTIVS